MAPVIESAGARLLIVLCVVICTVLLSNQYLEELLPQVKVSAEVAWGLVSKGYGLLYVMVFASFHNQVVPLCGKKGVSPVSDLLSRASKDFPGYRKVLYFPTLLWLDDSDAMLVALNGVGLLAGLLAICGGLAGWLGLLVARVCLQSLAVAGEFWYVWDYMVLEAGALVLLLPTSAPLPALSLTSMPAPCVALAWQFLAIRLMLGFAKTKFGGARVFEDNLYLQGFFIWQLLPNKLSWYLHHAPLWFLRAGYVFMLYVEVILPLCAFWGGAPRYIAACGLIALMFGIYMTGNWGAFNFGYAIVCVGLFDLDVAYSSFFSARELGDCFWSDILLRPLMTVYMFLSLIYCFFDTWTNTSWPYYYWEIIPEFQLHGLIGLIRLLGPFRLISSYGVFPPEALPQVRTTLVYEGSQGKAKMADAEKLPPLDDDTASGPECLEAPKGAVKISPGRFWQARAEEHVHVKDGHADSTDKMLQKQAEILKRLDHQTELLSLLVSKPPLGMRRISLERPEVAACHSSGCNSGCNSGCHSSGSQPVRAKVNYDEPARPKRTSFTPHLFKTFSQTELSRRREAKAVSVERSVTAAMSSEAPPYCAERLVKHPGFDLFFTVVVVTNSIFIGVELQLSMSTGCRSIPVQAVQYVYTLLFTLELVLRVLGQGPSLFWRDEWTWAWLDLFIVATSLWEVAVDVYYYSQGNTDLAVLSGMSSLKAFRIIRITRLIKAVRLVRILRFVMAFRTLITSILHTLKSLFWALMLLALIIYVFAVLFTQAVNDVLKDPESGLSQADIDASVLYFGTLPETMLSLFMSICGGVSWENVLAPLKSMSVIWVLLYLFYIAFTYFAVMNVVTAVFCQSAIDGAQNDHASKVHAILSNKEEHLGKIRALFSQFGAEDGVITFDLFREKIKSPEVRHYFQTLGLDVWDAWSFFKLLDEDAGGAVEIEEFLMGCLRLRGQATAMDVGKIINDQQWLIRNQGKFHAYMEVELRQLKEQVSILTGVNLSSDEHIGLIFGQKEDMSPGHASHESTSHMSFGIEPRLDIVFTRQADNHTLLGKTWKTYPYRYQPHSKESVPCRLAPHHARLDHRAHYPFEVTSKSDLTSAYSLTDHNPYCYTPVSFAHRVAQRLLEGEESVLGLFASNPFPEKAPAFVRVTGYGLSPCSIAHHQKTGNWWHAQQLCEVVPPRQTDPSIWQRWVPHAECFHPEHEVWRSRSGPVQALRASDPSDVDAAVVCEGIGKDEVAAFWSEFIPSVQRARGDWASLPSRAREVAERTAPAKLALYERLLARYVLLLLRQVSPQLVQQIGIAILFGTWRLHLLLHDVVAEGKDAYMDTLKNPESLLPRAEKIQDPQLLDLLGLLRPADLQFEDCKFHYHYAAKQRPDRRGFLKSICEFDYGGMYSFVKFMAQQPSLSPLWLPKAELLNSGAWIVEGYQDQGEATASSLSAPLVRWRRTPSEDSRRCERHKRVLFVKTVVGASLSSPGGKIEKTVEIPYGHCEVGL
ncbi:Lmf1, partial [Symbiodinium sp. CCMP2456]